MLLPSNPCHNNPQAYDLAACRLVACKIHQLSPHWAHAKKENYIKHATREYEIQKDLRHRYIVGLYGASGFGVVFFELGTTRQHVARTILWYPDVFEIDDNSFCTVLEHCDGQDLDFVLKQQHTLSGGWVGGWVGARCFF